MLHSGPGLLSVLWEGKAGSGRNGQRAVGASGTLFFLSLALAYFAGWLNSGESDLSLIQGHCTEL